MATFIVTTTADTGEGSLRQAILDANTAGGINTIIFDLPAGSTTILVGDQSNGAPLPTITPDLTIDESGTPGIIIDASSTVPAIPALLFKAGTLINTGSISGGVGISGTEGSGAALSVSGAGSITGVSGDGISVNNGSGAVALGTSAAPLGAILGIANGIEVTTSGAGAITIVTGGTVTGSNGDGIDATANGTGIVSIKVGGDVSGAFNGINVIAASVGNTLTVGGGATVSGVIGLEVNGGGTTTLSNGGTIATTANGGTAIQIDAGTLNIGDAVGTISGAIVDAGTLAFTNTGAITFASGIAGAGSVSQTGTGTTTLSGANTYDGGTLLAAGTLELAAATVGSFGSITSAAAGTGAINFSAGAQTLRVDTVALGADDGHTLANAIVGFGVDGDIIDVCGIGQGAKIAFDYALDTLTFSDASNGSTYATLHVTGDYSGKLFAASSDGGFGMQVTVSQGTNVGIFAGLSNDTGSSSTDHVTSDATITGVTDVGAALVLTDAAGDTLASTTAGADGHYTLHPTGISDGTYALTVTETYAGQIKTASIGLTLDSTGVDFSGPTGANYSSTTEALNVNLAAGTADGPSGGVFGHKAISGVDNVLTGAGDDLINGNAHDNVLSGGLGNDVLFGGAGNDVLSGGDGNDTLVGHGGGADQFVIGHDVLSGGIGDDVLYAAAGDGVSGGAGHDVLYVVNAHDFSLDLGASSIEYVVSDFGNDSFDAHTQTASVQIYAGGGNDVVTGSDHGDVVYAGSGNDTVLGGTGNDTIIGDTGADSLSGGGGDDTLYVDSSDVYVDGGAGHNAAYITGVPGDPGLVLDVAASHFAFVADFAGNNDYLDGTNATEALTIYAGAGNDTVAGGSGADVLWGQAGNDHLVGNGGSDVLVGGTGADTLEGGAGIDTLYFNSGGGSDGARDVAVLTPGSGTDIVFDFTPGEDQIDLTAYHTTFAALTITANGPHAGVYLGSTFLASVANQAGHLSAADFVL